MRLSKLLANLLLLAISTSCASFKTSDWQASITLPASLDCYSYNVMSGREERLPADSPACEYKKLHSVWIDSESYKMLKRDILTNCRRAKCKQITGAFDDLFLAIDNALQKIPIK
jgi:hypothetical protein